tara:strand:+ start:719 stop:1267 length:549 start_codon:yes stop_codon:yes gene_type:complete
MTRLNFPTARRALEHSIADVLDGYRDIDEALTEAANMVARGNIRFTAAGYTVTPHLICQAVREQRRLAHVGSRMTTPTLHTLEDVPEAQQIAYALAVQNATSADTQLAQFSPLEPRYDSWLRRLNDALDAMDDADYDIWETLLVRWEASGLWPPRARAAAHSEATALFPHGRSLQAKWGRTA